MDIRKIKKLIELLEESDVEELEIHEGDDSVRISRRREQPVGTQYVSQIPAPAPQAATPAEAPAPAADAPAAPSVPAGHTVKSPMVGTFYRAPSPTAAPCTSKASSRVSCWPPSSSDRCVCTAVPRRACAGAPPSSSCL